MKKKVSMASRNPADSSGSNFSSESSSGGRDSSQEKFKHLTGQGPKKRKRGNLDEKKYFCPECKCKDFRSDNLKRHIRDSHDELFKAWPNFSNSEWARYCSQKNPPGLEQGPVSESKILSSLTSGQPTPTKRAHTSPSAEEPTSI